WLSPPLSLLGLRRIRVVLLLPYTTLFRSAVIVVIAHPPVILAGDPRAPCLEQQIVLIVHPPRQPRAQVVIVRPAGSAGNRRCILIEFPPPDLQPQHVVDQRARDVERVLARVLEPVLAL